MNYYVALCILIGPALGGGIKLKVQGNSHRSWRVWLEDAPCVLAHKRCWAHYESLRLFGWPFRGHSSLRSPRLAVPRPTRSALEDRPLPRREKKKVIEFFAVEHATATNPSTPVQNPPQDSLKPLPKWCAAKSHIFQLFAHFSIFFFAQNPIENCGFWVNVTHLKSQPSMGICMSLLNFNVLFFSENALQICKFRERHPTPKSQTSMGMFIFLLNFLFSFFLKMPFKSANSGKRHPPPKCHRSMGMFVLVVKYFFSFWWKSALNMRFSLSLNLWFWGSVTHPKNGILVWGSLCPIFIFCVFFSQDPR